MTRARLPLARAFAVLIVFFVASVRADVSGEDPFRVVQTPTGCAVVFDDVADEYRVDALADGGVVVGLPNAIASQEKTMSGSCVARYRVWATAGGSGSSLEVRPSGVEFSGVINSKNRLQIVFEKVVSVSGSGGAPDSAIRDYKIGAGDALKITVYNHEDLSKEFTVSSGGKIGYSLLGDVDVAGKTARELQDELTAALAKTYIVNPQVSVEVKTFASQFVYVNGPVKTPGRFPLQGGLTLKDAVSLAGGFIPESGYSLTVARRTAGADGQPRPPEKILFTRQDIEFGLANIDLRSGDVVTVSDKDYVYIQQEVREPGKYEVGKGLTLLRAIALAKGPTDWADKKRIALIREVDGKTVRETVNLKDIERQKAPDVPLFAGDIIIVPRRIL